jgi:HlyD family secretion protein
MKRSTMITAGVATALVVALVVWAFAPRPLAVELAQVVEGPFETTIDEDGQTRLSERYVVSAPLAGRLDRVGLREGDAVSAGDVLARLHPVLTPLMDERSRREQQARVEGAQAAVRQATKRVEAARVARERAQDEVRRSEQLAQQGFIAATKLETDRLGVQAAQKELEAAMAGQQMAAYDLEQTRVALGLLRSPLPSAAGQGFDLRAPVAGQVLKVHVASEATVGVGAPLIEIGDVSQLEIVAELLTTDALQALPGRLVRIDRWGGPTVLQGRVRRVEPAAFTKVSALGVEEQRVRVVIDITSPREQWLALGDGYRVVVSIVTQHQDKVVKVPIGAVFPQAAPARGAAVFVSDGGRARLQPVAEVARNGSDVWVRDGVTAGTSVLVYPPPGVSDGVRIQARQP